MYISNRFIRQNPALSRGCSRFLPSSFSAPLSGCSAEPRGEKTGWLPDRRANGIIDDESKLIDTGHGTVELSILNKVAATLAHTHRSAVKSGMPVLFC